MRLIALVFIILGVALAGGAAYFGQQYISRLEAMAARQSKPAKTVKVWAAQRQLNYGDRITNKNYKQYLRLVEWPAKAVPKGSFPSLEKLFGEDKSNFRTVLRTIEPGELILVSKVTGFNGSARVATRVAEGKRAFTIPINAVSGVAGLVRPGDRVDILLTRSINKQLTTSVILQNVLVIATDQVANTESDRARVASTATVEVDPTEAQRLTLAQQVGRLTLTLRGAAQADLLEPEETAPIRVGDLPDTPEALPAAPAPAPADPGVKVRVRKGGAVQEIRVD